MSQRLAQLREESITGSGRTRSARIALEAETSKSIPGFSEDLKHQIEQRIAGSAFRSENAQAIASTGLSAYADRATQATAAAKPWTGSESVEAASARMLNDSYRAVKAPRRAPTPSVRMPTNVDAGRPRAVATPGSRIANARDRTSRYSLVNDSAMSEDERNEYRRQLKERFQPASRAIPATLAGLASLANERIDDAIARGQFKHIPRGEKLERDYAASSPFLDTTEYFMNKIIQKQEIVPPWIEKQQEVVSTATKFRSRLRADWRRHVARLIASRGGDLESQIALAEAYAAAEARLSQPDQDEPSSVTNSAQNSHAQLEPFRDPTWEAAESSYHKLAISNLNSLTRTYNLMAPQLAKKPYFDLARELKNCYAHVAPSVAQTIRERSWVPPAPKSVGGSSEQSAGVLARLGGPAARVFDEGKTKRYGFKEFWRDLFAS